MSFVKIANVNDVRQGQGKTISVNGVEIALFNIDGNFYAIDNTCPHRGGPLGEGMLDDGIVTCPWHGWKFNVATGKNVSMPVDVKRFEVKVEGEDVLVDV